MDDLISRRAVKKWLARWDGYISADIIARMQYRVIDIPSAQPEIIQCKDCKNWDTTWQNDWAKNYHYCPLIDAQRNGNWYCADAERRADE